LLIDLDPQANSTTALGFEADFSRPSVYDVMVDRDKSLSSVISATHVRGLRLAPSDLNLASVEIALANYPGREAVLRRKLAGGLSGFDYCIIDCPPSLGLLTVNSLTGADEVIIPIQMGYFALEGVRQLLRIIDLVKENLEHRALRICGVVCNFFDARSRLSKEVLSKVRERFGPLVFDAVIRRSVALDEAASHHQTIYEYAPRSRAARSFRDLVLEVIGSESGPRG